MKFLSNTYDPLRVDARSRLCYTSLDEDERDAEWRGHMIWINSHSVGRPKATKSYTCEQLEAMGMVGVYKTKDTTP